jgi:hypothetical protein
MSDPFSATRHARANQWVSTLDIDPLSCVLIVHQIEPYCKGDKDIRLATLARYFDRRTPWIDSFQYAWIGQINHGSSIGGYLVGRKLRQRYLAL